MYSHLSCSSVGGSVELSEGSVIYFSRWQPPPHSHRHILQWSQCLLTTSSLTHFQKICHCCPAFRKLGFQAGSALSVCSGVKVLRRPTCPPWQCIIIPLGWMEMVWSGTDSEDVFLDSADVVWFTMLLGKCLWSLHSTYVCLQLSAVGSAICSGMFSFATVLYHDWDQHSNHERCGCTSEEIQNRQHDCWGWDVEACILVCSVPLPCCRYISDALSGSCSAWIIWPAVLLDIPVLLREKSMQSLLSIKILLDSKNRSLTSPLNAMMNTGIILIPQSSSYSHPISHPWPLPSLSISKSSRS